MQIVWELDNLAQLGDNKLDVSGRPAVIAGPYGPAIEFDGVGDALFVGTNPLAGLAAFTIELDLRHD
ncbi:MAG: LamG domain-containing protein, partial [Gemmatimonadetes bacterium]|nr:LamG domain-containing protein [Gemmatimonadota bacterium]